MDTPCLLGKLPGQDETRKSKQRGKDLVRAPPHWPSRPQRLSCPSSHTGRYKLSPPPSISECNWAS